MSKRARTEATSDWFAPYRKLGAKALFDAEALITETEGFSGTLKILTFVAACAEVSRVRFRMAAVCDGLSLLVELSETARSQAQGSKSDLLQYLRGILAAFHLSVPSYIGHRHKLPEEDRKWQDDLQLDLLVCTFEQDRRHLIEVIYAFTVNWEDLTKGSPDASTLLHS
jgi:hypothetical protein